MLTEILAKPGPHLSFEFFPPKDDDGLRKIYETIRYLARFRPDFVSITWGAGGSTVRKSLEIAGVVSKEIGVRCIAHFTGLGMKKSDVDEILAELRNRHIHDILVLRGDIPHHMDKKAAFHDGFGYASELVRYIRSGPQNTPEKLGILVAGCPEGHPEAVSWEDDMNHTADKIKLGAEGVITQLFLENSYFYNFVNAMKKRDISVPVIAGIMIITRSRMIKRIIELSGCRVPSDLAAAIKQYENDDESMEKFGIEYAARQVSDLWDHGFRHFHFYTMNRSGPVEQVLLNLKDKL